MRSNQKTETIAQRKTEPRPKLATSATQVSEPETETTALAVQEPVNGAATVTSVGRLLLFNCQHGIYRTHDDGAELPDGTEFMPMPTAPYTAGSGLTQTVDQ